VKDFPSFREFEGAARRAFAAIPSAFREGVDGLVVEKKALRHPTQEGVYTLGECITESYPSEWEGPDTLRSVVALYWGSFRALAADDPGFDWEEELWETLTHEVRHHLESLAGDDALEGVDYAADETFRRDEGLPFDPWYFEHGDEIEPGVFRVEERYYVEQIWKASAFEAATHVEFSWRGEVYRTPRPEELGDVHFLWIEGIGTGAAEALEVVLVRRRSWWEDVKRLGGGYTPRILESVVRVEPAPDAG